MPTGTGKTYVYLRTIFELSRKYGFQKFIIVVPSVAILEGVLKNIEITAEHFRTLYNNNCWAWRLCVYCRKGRVDGEGCSYIDLYRVENGKIAECWGFPEKAPTRWNGRTPRSAIDHLQNSQ